MKILLCNPANTQGTKHSRKGMYVPLGILSLATCLEKELGSQVQIDVIDEDVEFLNVSALGNYHLVGLYATTFNYGQAVTYATAAKQAGCITVLGGPHPTVLAKNILTNQTCFDYVVRFEAEHTLVNLVSRLLENQQDTSQIQALPNMAMRDQAGLIHTSGIIFENNLADLPIPSRKFIRFDQYVDNYLKVYPEKAGIIPGSIYSSKGCSWRDKTGGCIFCARLENGVRFRDIDQIWAEIHMLQQEYGVNSIWDIADDNLNNKEWFINFVERRPRECRDVKFFIYSRVNPIKPWVIPYFQELNVEEVFLGIESGDNRLLKMSFKGQTREISLNALKLLNEHQIKFYPSFVLGLPGESKESLENTLELCRRISDLGGLDRMSATILKPIPGSKAYDRVLSETDFGPELQQQDDIDLAHLEKYWIGKFTEVSYDTVQEYRNLINDLMGRYHVFGSGVNDKS